MEIAGETIPIKVDGLDDHFDLPVMAVKRFADATHHDGVGGGERGSDLQFKHILSIALSGPVTSGPSPDRPASCARFVGVTDAPLMLSVSGARGLVGRSMTDAVATRFANAFGSHLRTTNPDDARRLAVIGRDGRGSGTLLAAAAAKGLRSAGFDVVDIGIVATPTVGVMISELGAIGGISVTASHNPIEWNGLKTLNADGLALPTAEANEVIARFRSGSECVQGNQGASSERTDADQTHVARVLAHIDGNAIRACGFRVALDSVNGGGARSGRMLLDALGCEVVHLNAEHTGTFAHTPEPIESNLGQLMEVTARDGMVAVGFAQDPDADRLTLVDERGRFLGEEYTLVLSVLRLLQREGSGILATNLSTSRMIDAVAAKFPGTRVVRTAVGEANVVAGIRASGGFVGGEGNGGLIWPTVCWVRDSLSAMALLLELLATEGRPLSDIAAEIPSFSMVKRKLELASVGGHEAVAPALARVRAHFSLIEGARLDEADGIRIDFRQGWVHLRASNTEPIIRVIAESDSRHGAESLCDECARVAGLAP